MVQTVSEIAALWSRILEGVKPKINDQRIFDSFFSGSYIDTISGNMITVVVNSGLAKQILTTKYSDLVGETIHQCTESDFQVRFVQQDEIRNFVEEKKTKPSFFGDSLLRREYTFDNFVVGDSNREAYQAALMIAKNPGKLYNPLLIYSGSGLGKTHLLNAIGNSVKEQMPNLRVLYVTTQDFFDEFVKYVKGDTEGENLKDFFKNSVDVLLVDDIQFLVGKSKTEDMFFTIFNTLYGQGKQIVITSDQHPNQLNGLDERLRTRFASGLPLSMKSPDEITCESILKMRIETSGLDVNDFDPEVITFFARRFSKSVRELDGAYNRLLFYTINIKPTKHISLNVAMESVKDIIDIQEDKTKLSEGRIINTVADYYNLTASQLTGKIRTSQIAMARHISMYLIRSLLDVPFTKIGFEFGGKDHATVMNGVEKVDNAIKTDQALKKAIDELTQRLKN